VFEGIVRKGKVITIRARVSSLPPFIPAEDGFAFAPNVDPKAFYMFWKV